MLITVTNPFDNQEIEVNIEIVVNGSITQDGVKTVSVSAIGTQVV
jgi:hypothetical protein